MYYNLMVVSKFEATKIGITSYAYRNYMFGVDWLTSRNRDIVKRV